MKTKQKKYKHTSETSTEYADVIDNYKFEANIYDDNSGEMQVYKGKKCDIYCSSGKLEDWIQDVKEEARLYINLSRFLSEIQHLRSKQEIDRHSS